MLIYLRCLRVLKALIGKIIKQRKHRVLICLRRLRGLKALIGKIIKHANNANINAKSMMKCANSNLRIIQGDYAHNANINS